ncbi:hypothetical protein niasHT_036632 [Heterodera trifolii]|uniref:Uncharacterized protein n=1 Tax=Heterodera trifolii TaxID=157864 RepID=A0ABD2HYH7_9BILA
MPRIGLIAGATALGAVAAVGLWYWWTGGPGGGAPIGADGPQNLDVVGQQLGGNLAQQPGGGLAQQPGVGLAQQPGGGVQQQPGGGGAPNDGNAQLETFNNVLEERLRILQQKLLLNDNSPPPSNNKNDNLTILLVDNKICCRQMKKWRANCAKLNRPKRINSPKLLPWTPRHH